MKKFIIGLFALAMVAGCTGTRTLYKKAETPTQYAKVVLLHHNAVGEEVANLLVDPTVSVGSKDTLRKAYRVTVCDKTETGPIATCRIGPSYQLTAAGKAYEAVKDAETEEQLQAALNTLVSLLTNVITAIKGAH